VRPDLAQVGLHGRGRFRKVERRRRLQRACERDHLLADPGERQEAEELIVAIDRVLGHEARADPQQVRVREHRELRLGRRARGGAEDRHVVGPALLDLVLPPAGRALGAAALHLGELDQVRLLVGLQASRVVMDHPLDMVDGTSLHELYELVDLLLVSGHHEAHPRMGEQVRHLVSDGVGKEPEGSAPERLGGELGDHPLWAVVAEDGDRLASVEAEAGKPRREVAHALLVLGPGDRLPDSVALLAQRMTAWVLGGALAQQPRQRRAWAHAGCASVVACGSPR